MRPQGAAIHGVLAVAGLVAAYATWQRAPEVAAGDVVVIEGTKASLEKLRHRDRGRWIELARKSEGGEALIWIRQGRDVMLDDHAGGAVLDGGMPADGGMVIPRGEVVAVVPGKERELRGNDRAEKLFERFMPLRAARALGVLGAGKQKELGLETSQDHLEITAAGVTHSFLVGTSVSGVGTPYLKDEKDGKVYLLAGSLLSELDPASQQLVDRRLHAFKPAEFDALVVKAGALSREFVQTGAELPQTAKLAPRDAPDKPDDFARNWHDKAWTRLIASEVLGRGEAPPSGEPTLALRLDYLAKGKPRGWLEVARGKGSELWARSEQTAGWVLLLGGADEVLAESAKVLGAP
ncbi:MAG: DUF4340 domain-containing protein [Myxococcaceae bacterium]